MVRWSAGLQCVSVVHQHCYIQFFLRRICPRHRQKRSLSPESWSIQLKHAIKSSGCSKYVPSIFLLITKPVLCQPSLKVGNCPLRKAHRYLLGKPSNWRHIEVKVANGFSYGFPAVLIVASSSPEVGVVSSSTMSLLFGRHLWRAVSRVDSLRKVTIPSASILVRISLIKPNFYYHYAARFVEITGSIYIKCNNRVLCICVRTVGYLCSMPVTASSAHLALVSQTWVLCCV